MFPGVKQMEAMNHGEFQCVVVIGTRPIYDVEEQTAIAKELAVETEGKVIHAPHLCKLAEDHPGLYRTAFYVGGAW